jgi:hypothetical protein
VAILKITKNRVTQVTGDGEGAEDFRRKLALDPLYGNVAEFGLGSLGKLGVEAPLLSDPSFPVVSTLLYEKLGLHIAFGTSKHLGGTVDENSYNDKSLARHKDYVFIAALQPLVTLQEIRFKP